MEMNGKTEDYLNQLCSALRRDVPEHVVNRAKESLLDYLACVYAGRHALEDRGKRLEAVVSFEKGAGLAIGLRSDLPAKEAAFLNGFFAHALDFDDGVNRGIIHLGSPVFSVLLPLAAICGCTGKELLFAAIGGYEAAWTLADTVQPNHKLRGYHATGTCGCVGAAFAGSLLLGFSADEMFRTVSTALVSTTGMLKVLDDASELKPYNVAKAALLAMAALQVGKAGFDVPDDALGGVRGFLEMFAGSQDLAVTPPISEGLYAIERTYTKPYAACRYCHPAIEAASLLGEEMCHDYSAIESIKVRTYDLAVRGHDHDGLESPSSAKMSIPYGVAVAFLFGRAGLAEYEPSVHGDYRVAHLSRIVRVYSDSSYSEAFPVRTVATVEARTSVGEVVSRTVEFPKGEPEYPLGSAGVCSKFKELVAWSGMSDLWASEVIDCVMHVEDCLPQLLELLNGRTA